MNKQASHRHIFRFTAYTKDGTIVERELLLNANADSDFFGWEEFSFFEDISKEGIKHITHLYLRQATEEDIINESIRIAKSVIDDAFAKDKHALEGVDGLFLIRDATNRALNYRHKFDVDKKYTDELAYRTLETALLGWASIKYGAKEDE